MDESFRSPRQIIEPALNVLIGTHATHPEAVKTRGFADIATLKEKELISVRNGHIRVLFAPRESDSVTLTLCTDKKTERIRVAERCERLMHAEGLLPQDILVLTFKKTVAIELADAIAARIGKKHVRCAFADKGRLAVQENCVTVSTIATAKGYDAPYVLLASVDDFSDDVEGRASFYVGCTRAREWLDVSAAGSTPLVRELQLSMAASNS